jgi:putative FmdB family regulatory protein
MSKHPLSHLNQNSAIIPRKVPTYEYEKLDGDCEICPGRFAAIQTLNEPQLTHCPTCGLKVRKVISQANFKTSTPTSADRAAQHGLTTYKRAQEGTWEKVAGQGVDVIQGTPDQIKAAKQTKRKPVNLD